MYKKVPQKITILIIMAAILTVPSTMLQVSQAQLDSNAQNAILTAHNNERNEVGVQPLTWSNSLATQSQSYANQLVSQGYVCNAQSCNPNIPHGANNENLAWGSPGFPLSGLVQSWADEKSLYNGQPIPSGFDPSGHYTAMVWQDTREIGCGLANSASIDILVCRYNPGGNIIGQMPFGNTNQAVTDEESTFNPDQGAIGAEDTGADNSGNSNADSTGESNNDGSGEDSATDSGGDDNSDNSNEGTNEESTGN